VNFWNDWHDKATGQKSASERRAESHDRNRRTEQSREQQDQHHSQGDQQSQDAGHGYDPAAITQHDSWSSWDHKNMKTMVDGVDVNGINTHGETWTRVGTKLSSDFEQFHAEVTSAVKGGWTGDAATAAATAPDGMAKWGKAMGSASQGTGSRMQQASSAAKQAQINMPDPVEFSWRRSLVNGAGGMLFGGLGGGAIAGGSDAYSQHQEAQQAKQQAVNVMDRMYTQGYVDVDRTTPAFAAPDGDGKVEPPDHKPVKPIVEPPGHRPPGHTGGGDHNGSDHNGIDTGNGQVDQPTDPGRTDPSQFDDSTDDANTNLPTDPGRTDPSQLDPNGGRTGGGQGGADPRGAPAAANAGGGMGGGMPMMGGGGGMGGAGDNEYGGRGYGRGGGLGSGAGSGANDSGSGGRSGIGGSAAQEAMGGARGAGGRGGGGMGGGRGGRKEEDAEHESPDYLVETDDVFGSGEMVAPPVIGGE
jgi:hypothetical protein